MRIIIKGGVWKNTEDEILKAAVMKYGKNQWARISSLLNRKTPKQCKARWFEWLDPSIKKTEWSREEDEKLLHLAKLMPTQWRTIAPIVGRTPSQCLERYQRLLDEAEMKEGEENDQGQASDDVRRLRPGEIDPNPESKPARPDPIDMDEDEKEMLSEARARLANTQGKKAKRKAREKQLEESRRLAALQKRRELKAAGIELKYRRKTKGMNYNADIPFHKRAPAGFWDTSEEHERELKEKKDKTNILLENLEGKRRADIEEAERKKDIKRQKLRKEKGEIVPQSALKALEEQKKFKSERRKLVLPAPQITENELEEIAKIGYSSENIRSVVDSDENRASSTLLNDYTSIAKGTPLRTPRTSERGNNLAVEARNLRAMSMSQTPLLGDRVEVSDIENGTGYEGATPRHQVQSTPNPLMSQYVNTPQSSIGNATPLRDEMGINTPMSGGISETPRMERMKQNLIRKQLNEQFSKLPKPKNDFELIIPSKEEDEILKKTDDDEEGKIEDDTEDVIAREKKRKAEEEEKQRKLQSHAVQENLPRPHLLDFEQLIKNAKNDIEKEIAYEMISMMAYDAKRNPYITGQVFGKMEEPEVIELVALATSTTPNFTKYTIEELDEANKLIEEEVKNVVGQMDELDIENEFEKIHKNVQEEQICIYGDNEQEFQYKNLSDVNKEEMIKSLKTQLESNRGKMSKDATKARKLEKRLGIVLGGYQGRGQRLRKDINEQWKALEQVTLEHTAYSELLHNEETLIIPHREEELSRAVHELQQRENELQSKYRELMAEYNSIDNNE